jgi:hypothetical protein
MKDWRRQAFDPNQVKTPTPPSPSVRPLGAGTPRSIDMCSCNRGPQCVKIPGHTEFQCATCALEHQRGKST